MKQTSVLKEAARLHKLGLAIHWLHPKSKRPVELKWTTGPRKTWEYLKETYMEGLNVGVRLGGASHLTNGFLAVIDVDVKSKDERHRKEALAAAKKLLKGAECPVVKSGRGNGSRHYYCVTASPFKTFNPAASTEQVKALMPSKSPSKKELATLSEDEIKQGIRIANAWEISLYSDGRQVVLPPSIHPDSGKPYFWASHLTGKDSLPVLEFENAKDSKPKTPPVIKMDFLSSEEAKAEAPFDFEVTPVMVDWLDISDRIRRGILTGDDVTDRSAFLLPATSALVSAGCSRDEILTVLTDRKTFLGACAYDHSKSDSRARAALWLWKYTVKRVMEERDVVARFREAHEVKNLPALSEDDAKNQAKEFEDEWDWRQDITRTGQKGDGPPKSSIENVVLILTHAVSEVIFRRDEFCFRNSYGVDTVWGGKIGNAIQDDDIPKIKMWLGENYRFEPGKDIIYDAVTVIAYRNSFDPVKDWLEALPAWDGTARLGTWLVQNFEAEGDKEYLAQVFTKWITAMVLRVYEPGAKFDWMPIFEGAQGIGKSSFGRLLCGDSHFLDWLPNLADKDSALALQGMWAVEMSELATLKKNEIEVVKGFLTRTVDKVRPPFGRVWVESSRRCVFFGTTNRETYLKDDSGNRRFKPVKVGGLDFGALKRDRDQLFAEAKQLYQNGVRGYDLELTGAAADYERKIHVEKTMEDDSHTMKDLIESYLEKERDSDEDERSFKATKFRMIDLFSGQGPLWKWKLDNRNMQFAAKAVKLMGGEKWKSDGVVYWKMPKGDRFEETHTLLDFT